MKGKRERLAQLLDHAGVWEAVLWLRQQVTTPWLPALTYHRVASPDKSVLDRGVVDASPEQFERQIEFLSRHFHPIGVEELLAAARGAALPRNPVVITFDDGYRECYEVVLPILKRYGARAIFFVTTGYTTSRRLFWWDRLAFLLHSARGDELRLRYPIEQTYPLNGSSQRTLDTLIRLVKTYFDLDVDLFLEEVARAAAVEWNLDRERELADAQMMTWDQVAGLAAAGMDVQSHTRFHRVLGTLPAKALVDELAGSRRDLMERIDQPIVAIAYPVGYSIAQQPHIRAAILAAGYQLGFTNQGGVNHLRKELDLLDVRRCAMDSELSDALFRGMMAFPYLARTEASPEPK
jgi:peptidoglycan/xylan/chitin deacetylase (PgdA/CDA1 family)